MKKAVCAVALLSMIATSGFSQPGFRHRDEGDRRPRQEMKEKLNLSEDQESKVEKLRTDHLKKMVQLRAKAQEARIDLKALHRTDNPDKDAIETAIRNISGLKLEMSLAQSRHHFAVREILTPEQRKVFKDHRGQRGGRDDHQRHMQKRHDKSDSDE
ncbi:MAG: Spy/CpxP family protein refolding chaperone [Bacteroidota bacterium]